MREILFRGQTRKKGEKVRLDGSPVDGNWVFGGVNQGEGDFSIIYQMEPEIHKYSVYTDTLGQYTGLTDKNGKRIFEGDILIKRRNSMTKYSNITDHLFAVEWCSDCGMWILTDIEPESYREIDFESFDAWEFEVIGNIHDNPELIKDGEHNAAD